MSRSQQGHLGLLRLDYHCCSRDPVPRGPNFVGVREAEILEMTWCREIDARREVAPDTQQPLQLPRQGYTPKILATVAAFVLKSLSPPYDDMAADLLASHSASPNRLVVTSPLSLASSSALSASTDGSQLVLHLRFAYYRVASLITSMSRFKQTQLLQQLYFLFL